MSDAVRIRFSLNTRCRFTEPAVNHVFRLRVLPAQTPGVTLTRETLIVSPQATLSAPLSEPLFGNRVVTGRIDAPHNTFEFTSEGEATLAAVPDVTPPHLWLARPTPLTAAGSRVSELNRCVANGQDTEGTISSLLAAAHGALAFVLGCTSS